MKRINRKKLIALFLAATLLLALFSGCGVKTEEKEQEGGDDFAGKKVGVVTGTVYEDAARKYYPKSEICFYNSCADLAEALEMDKIDAYVLDEPVGRLMVQSYPNQQLSSLLEAASYAFAFDKDGEQSNLLRSQFDAFVEKSRKNGVLQEIDDIWFGTDESRKTVSLDGHTGENGTVRLATSTDIGAPFAYIKDGAFVGYEVDLFVRFCDEYGYVPEITNYNFPALLIAVNSGKADVAACTFAITPERQETVNFSVPTYEGGVVTVTKTASAENASEEYQINKIGFVTGSMHEDIARKYFPEAEMCYYNTYVDLAEALDMGKLDAYILDEPVGRLMIQSYPKQHLSDVLEPAPYAYAFNKNNEHCDLILEQMNAFIEELSQSGALQEIKDLWFGDNEELKTINLDNLTGENGTIRFGASTDASNPFIYIKEDRLVGYEIDLMVRFCEKYGYALDITNYSFAGLMAAVTSGKAEVAASTITITEERKESVNFSVPTYEGGIAMMTRATSNAQQENRKKVGVVANSSYEDAARRLYSDDEICFYNNTVDLAKALDKGEIDYYLLDEPVGRLVIKPYANQEVSDIIEPASYAFAFPQDSEFGGILLGQMNDFIEESRQNGLLQATKDIWLGDDESKKTVSFDQLTGENGTIRLAISADIGEPFVYFKNGALVGYEVDLLAHFCEEYGYNLAITSYNFAALFPALTEGMNDMAACAITVTPEREEIIDFSLPTYDSGLVMVTRNGESEVHPGTPEEQPGFWESMKLSLERTFLRESRWKLFVKGLGVTFAITLTSLVLGSLGGFVVYLIIRRDNKVFNGIWAFFSSLMGRTPVVVILMIFYYIIFGHSNLNNVWISIIGFTVMFICTVTTLLQMGAGAVDSGQTEAALAMGYSKRQVYLRHIFPQSIEHFLPAYKSEVITLVKATAIVGYIAVQDLTKVSDLVRSRTYEAFFPLIATAIIYYLLTFVLTGLIRHINIAVDTRRRSIKRMLKGVKTE